MFICLLLCFVGNLGDRKGRKVKIYLECGAKWVQDVRALAALAILLTLAKLYRCSPFWRVPCLLPAFLLCVWCIGFEYGFISRFKGVYSGFYGVCVGLYCLRALRGLWGFCVREWLGGLEACCVFASIYSFICLYLPFFLSLYLHLVLLSFVGLVVFRFPLFVLLFSLWVFVFSFSLADYTQKERAQSVVLASFLRLLWVALSGCGFIFLVLVRCQPVYIVIEF